MSRYLNKIAFIVATKDRPQELERLLNSFERQTYPPDQVVVVDGGSISVAKLVKRFIAIPVTYMHCAPPSATRQRNMGLSTIFQKISLIGFCDDDVVFEPKAIETMMDFWEHVSENVGGAAFNMINHPPLYGSWLKSLPLMKGLGLYSKERGVVSSSGFHTIIDHVSKNINVQWLPTTAVVWQRNIFDEHKFDEWFGGYSYLEDLDFSYQVGKKKQLFVVKNAQYYHFPASTGRNSSYIFGKREVLNRLYFVKKHQELSLFKCYLVLILRIFISIGLAIQERKSAYLKRTMGSIIGLLYSI